MSVGQVKRSHSRPRLDLCLAGSAADGKIKNERPGADGGGRTKWAAKGLRSLWRHCIERNEQDRELPERRTREREKGDRPERRPEAKPRSAAQGQARDKWRTGGLFAD